MQCVKKSQKIVFVPISFRGQLSKCTGMFSTADEPTSCGEVLRKLMQRQWIKKVWKRKKKLDAKCSGHSSVTQRVPLLHISN